MVVRLKQCAKCPWRVGVDPHDIPHGYCEVKHRNLESTIAEPGRISLGGTLPMMACHESSAGDEIPCVGWLHNQLGRGNNIALRIWHSRAVERGEITGPLKLVGQQHECFEDTLPGRVHRTGGEDVS
jgi:hypothetical protein